MTRSLTQYERVADLTRVDYPVLDPFDGGDRCCPAYECSHFSALQDHIVAVIVPVSAPPPSRRCVQPKTESGIISDMTLEDLSLVIGTAYIRLPQLCITDQNKYLQVGRASFLLVPLFCTAWLFPAFLLAVVVVGSSLGIG
mmetsp:Transcript_64373/g.188347  ORF Transcript_64373/g.188347 Transcript_64373/m.188347 type:complete len:141 (-) Transcript_64373:193-615(-)